MPPPHRRVVIIGGGAAGLQCARSLLDDHDLPPSSVLVVEARPFVGGRVQQTTSFVPGQEVDLGAELLHGDSTRLNEYARKGDWPLQPLFTWAQGDGGPDESLAPDGGYALYWIGGKAQRMLPWDSDDPEVRRRRGGGRGGGGKKCLPPRPPPPPPPSAVPPIERRTPLHGRHGHGGHLGRRTQPRRISPGCRLLA